MMCNAVNTKEIEDLVRKKGPGLVMINALELPWIELSQFDTAMETLIKSGRLTLHEKIGDWVMGNLTHYEVEASSPTWH